MTPLPIKSTAFYASFLVCLMVIVSIQTTFAQKQYTTISKNINPESQGLYHDLSPQGDSLYLGAQSIFYKVTMINSLDKKVFKFNPPVTSATIPLHSILVGDYTVMVYKKDRIIVFHISRLLEIDLPSKLEIFEQLPMITQLNNIEVPSSKKDLKSAALKERLKSNGIQMEDTFKLNVKETSYAMNSLNAASEHGHRAERPYNLSSVNRENMQSREAYRQHNLRPNGNPY